MDWFDFSQRLPLTDPTAIFLLVLLIILFAPIVLNKLHIPHIIGMILAGVIVGEHGFNILVRDSSFDLFGKVGLFYIMFLAGLEMNMSDFRQNRGKAMVLGVLAFVIPISIGLVTNMVLLKYGLLTSILLASMYASHTLVSYPIVIRYGISRQSSVSIAVGGTAVTDTFTLLVLAVISGLFRGESDDLFWLWLVIKFILVGILITFSFPRIGRWFFRKYNNGVIQFIFVLALVFLGAALMELAGMEGLLGACVVGLVLYRLIPHVSPLMNHLEFVGNALFIPYFLIGVGMMIDVRVILGHGNALLVAAVMIGVALLGKWIACWLTQKIYRMSSVERILMYGLSNAQAAATLATVLVGYNIVLPTGERLLNDDVLNGTILLILVTCVVSSFITERAARRMAIDKSLESRTPCRQERILIPIANPSTVGNLINLSLAIRDSGQEENLLALSVIDDVDNSTYAEMQGKHNLRKAAKITAAVDVPLREIVRYDRNIVSGIVHATKEYGITDVIIGMHCKNCAGDTLFGNLTGALLEDLYQEVMIARFLMPVNTLRRIIVTVPAKAEYEPGFLKWVEQICRLATALGGGVYFYAGKDTNTALQKWIRENYKQVTPFFEDMDGYEDLPEISPKVNSDHLLIIVAARQGTVSYDGSLEQLPDYIDRYFPDRNIIVLYPDLSDG